MGIFKTFHAGNPSNLSIIIKSSSIKRKTLYGIQSVMMKSLKVEDEVESEVTSKVEEKEELEETSRSNNFDTGENFSLTVDGMSNSIAVSFQWLDKVCGITPTSKRGQLIYMMAMLLIPLIPIFALVTQNVILLNDIIVKKSDLIESSRSVEKGDETANFIGALQQERSAALMSLFLREKFDSTQDKIDFDINSLRIATDTALENVTLWRAFSGEGLFRSKLRLQIRLDDFRKLHEDRNRSLRKPFKNLNQFFA